MPRLLATAITIVLILVLFRKGPTAEEQCKGALWLPIMWLAVTCSREVSQWINLGSTGTEEGALVDVVYTLALIMAGLYVLALRRVSIVELARMNPWLAAFVIFGLISIVWSDFPVISAKRWVKTMGHPIMALIILTEPAPANALRAVLKRCAYLIVPLSVLFIKYYPEYGRSYSFWTGEAYTQGIMTQKNELGYVSMILFLFFFWQLLTARRIEDLRSRRKEYMLSAGFLLALGWMLYMANSSTAYFSLAIGLVVMVVLGFQRLNKRFFGTYLVVAALVVISAEYSFDLYAKLLQWRGEDPTLTDRTEIWAVVLSMVENPLLGEGFEIFWSGDRLALIHQTWDGIKQAHNGFIETYLNLGATGVFLLLGAIAATYRKIKIQLLSDLDVARLKMGFLFSIVLFNYAEASFLAIHPLWTMFYIIALAWPPDKKRQQSTR